MALHPEPQSREKLAALFWGDSTDVRALHSLRNSFTTLRKYLGDDLLLTNRETAQVDPSFPLWVDVIEFHAQAKQFLAGLDSALVETNLYQGDLLADFYDDWIPAEREHYRNFYIEVLLRLAQEMRTHSEYDRAIGYARQVLACDPTNERAHEHLIFCYLAAGDRAAALRQYEECRRLLRDELAVEPKPETTALFEWIKRDSTQPRLPEASLTNLPIPITHFVGRQNEMARIKDLLATHRIVTLTGAGGSGKTRLAIQVATSLVESFKDGVWWTDLSALIDGTLIVPTAAQALGVPPVPNESPLQSLCRFLYSRELLLVLDNCEHLITACAQLADTLLTACPHLKMLTTSREALGLLGERIYHVPTLSLPDPLHLPSTELLVSYESIRLFVERAAAVSRDFSLTALNAPAVVEVCRRLDGMPLAIELAAARVRSLSVEQIEARLDDRFNLLTAGSRTALPRQQTLHATLDWSYTLLSEPEQVLFRRLSVFAGGWTLEAAEAVAVGVMSGLLHSPTPTLDLITRLIDKSLVVAEDRNNEARYHMLETVRQYGRDKLEQAGERQVMQNRHLEFFLKLAEEAEPHLTGADREAWLVRLESDHDNLRAALEWTETTTDQRSRLRLAGALAWFWGFRNYASEGVRWLERALEKGGQASIECIAEERALRAKALLGLGLVGWGIEEGNTTRVRLEESIALYEELGDRRRLAHSLLILGNFVGTGEGQFAAARPFLEQSLILLRTLLREGPASGRQAEDRWWLAYALNRLGEVIHHNDLEGARPILEEGLALAHELGDQWLIGQGLMTLGSVQTKLGDWASGHARFEEALDLFRHVDSKRNIGWALGSLGDIARYRGEYQEAARFYEDGLSFYRAGDDSDGISWMLYSLGCLALRDGEVRRAAELFCESLMLRKKIEHREGLAEVLQGLAGLAVVKAQPERAARLFGAAQAARELMKDAIRALYRAPSDPYLAMAREQIGDATFKVAWEEGHTMTSEQAIEYALKYQ
jgi:non-specific serine/threonine protein kinase